MKFTKTQLNKLTRTYPLKDKEDICYADLYYLYIELNLSMKELEEVFGKPKHYIQKYLNRYEIRKSKELVSKVYERICLEKYGVSNISKLPETREKYKQTCLEKYGVDNTFKSNNIKQKIQNTVQEKYGAKTFCESKYYDKDLEMKKREQTNLKKFSVTHPMKLEEYKDKQKESVRQKYGVDNVLQSELVQQKRKAHIESIVQKTYETKKKNQSFNISDAEEYIYKELSDVFDKVERQYSSEKYPYACDFYISELDLYIEYQGFWSHGNEPYNPSNKEHRKILEHWINKSKEINFKKEHKLLYENAINVWTVKDPEKRKMAKINNLNWIEFFNLEKFDLWLEKYRKEKNDKM